MERKKGWNPKSLSFNQTNPIDLDPNATAQPKNNPLPVAPSTDQVYILPSPASQSQPKTPEAPSTKATPSLPILQNFRKLVATLQNFVTTSKTLAVAYGIVDGLGADNGLEHPNFDISKLPLPPHFLF